MLDPWFNKRFPSKRLKKLLFWPWTEYRVIRDASATIFTCDEERLRSRDSFRPYQSCEETIGYGIDVPKHENPGQLRQRFLDQFPAAAGKRIVLFLGRLHPIKGCDSLLEAFARVLAHDPQFHLVMAGPGDDEYACSLRRLANRLGISNRVTWTGMLAGDLKWGAYYCAEAFMLPSHHENFGIVVVEALACGTPVLISNAIQIWREIVECGAGFADSDDLDGATRLLEGWMRLSEADRGAMASRAFACYERHYLAKTYVDKYHDVVDRHLAEIAARREFGIA